MKKIFIAAGLVLLLSIGLVILLNGVSRKQKEADRTTAPLAAQPLYAAAEGKVEAMPGLEVEVGSEIDGRIADIFFEEGSPVKKGALIAIIENRDIKAKLKEVEAELNVSKSKLREIASGAREEEIKAAAAELESASASLEYEKSCVERYRELYKKGVVSKELLDEKERNAKTAEARVKKASEDKRLLEKGPKPETIRLHEDAVIRAEAAVEYLTRLLEKTYIKSPISGKVIRKYFHKGETVSKDVQPNIVAVADVERVRVNAEVDETDIGRIGIGDAAEVTSYAYPGKVFRGRVQEISDYVGARKFKPNDPVRNLDVKIVQVKIALEDKTPFRIGMTVDVKITPTAR